MEYRRRMDGSVLESIKDEIFGYLTSKGFERANIVRNSN